MRFYSTILCLLISSNLFSQNCSCEKDKFLNEIINCDTTRFDNGSILYWSFNCDSSWLTFERPNKIKKILFSLDDFKQYTGRLGFTFAKEYKNKFLIQNNVISGCCTPPEYYLFDKSTGNVTDSLGNILYFSEIKYFPIIISIVKKHSTSTKHVDYNAFRIYNIDNKKIYFLALPKGELYTALKYSGKVYPELLFDEPILISNKLYLKYAIKTPKQNNKRMTKTVVIDLNQYAK